MLLREYIYISPSHRCCEWCRMVHYMTHLNSEQAHNAVNLLIHFFLFCLMRLFERHQTYERRMKKKDAPAEDVCVCVCVCVCALGLVQCFCPKNVDSTLKWAVRNAHAYINRTWNGNDWKPLTATEFGNAPKIASHLYAVVHYSTD